MTNWLNQTHVGDCRYLSGWVMDMGIYNKRLRHWSGLSGLLDPQFWLYSPPPPPDPRS